MRSLRTIYIGALVLLAVAGLLLWRTEGSPVAWPAEVVLQSASGPVTRDKLSGSVSLVYFGYTSCPAVCPMTMTYVGQALKQLSASEQSQVRGLFVSVDPARDDIGRLGEYVGYFGPRFWGATGDTQILQKLASAFDAPFEKVPGEDGEYEMSHSASVYLLDREARLFQRIDQTHDPKQIVLAVRRALGDVQRATARR
jgi:protein SCO1/2